MSGDFAISQMCEQKRQRSLFPTPPVRLQLPSPYRTEAEFQTGITKRQLDMRRKIEILKYQNNNGKTTSKQQFSLLAAASNSVNRRINTTDCMFTPTKTSSSNIPGPIIELTLDETIPLYNYLQRSLAVSSLPIVENAFFRFHKLQGQMIELNFVRANSQRYDMETPVTIGYLQIYEGIPTSLTSFQLTAMVNFTLEPGTEVTPLFEETNHLKIFFSETEMLQKKQIGTVCVPARTSEQTLITTTIDLLPTVDGYIYKLQYFFTNFGTSYGTSQPTLKCTINPADMNMNII